MRRHGFSALCLAVVAAVGAAVAAPAPVLAETGIPFQIDYQGVYKYHENAHNAGKLLSAVDETVGWSWSAAGDLPITSNGYSVENLPGGLTVAGASGNCTYSAGAGASTPIRLSMIDIKGFMEVGYGVGIPGAVAACGGPPGSQQPEDVLACDFNTCDRICPTAPAAVSTARFQTPVLTAFQPTSSYLKTGYLPLNDPNGNFWGTASATYNLPAADAAVRDTSCQKAVTESENLSITSTVTVSLPGDGGNLDVNFPDGQAPELTPPIDPIDMMPGWPGNPKIIIPPTAPQPPETTTPPPGPDPAVGVIGVRCPRRDRHCSGAISVSTIGGAPRGVLGRRSYSLTGGEDEILNVRLASNARSVLNRAGRLRVDVIVSSKVMPGSRRSKGHRTVLLTKFARIPGVPSR